MIDLSNIMAVSGLPHLYRMRANRPNGLVVEDLDTGRNMFLSARKYQVSPLESVSIYTMTDTIPVGDALETLKNIDEEIPTHDADPEIIKSFFLKAVPDYDPTRVHLKDMKKLFKWYHYLNEKDLLKSVDSGEEE